MSALSRGVRALDEDAAAVGAAFGASDAACVLPGVGVVGMNIEVSRERYLGRDLGSNYESDKIKIRKLNREIFFFLSLSNQAG